MLEAYVEIIGYIATLYGTVMALSYAPQIYKMYKRKSSADVSVVTYFLLLPGFIIWLLYGIGLDAFPIYFTNSIGSIVGIITIITYYIYKK